MLTAAVIKAQNILANLTDEQLAALETLSRNDENAVIAQRIGETAGRIEESVKTASGIDKNQGEKYYDYVARVTKELAAKTASGGDTATLQAEVDRLKAEAAKGGDTASRAALTEAQRKLADAENRVVQLQTQITEKETEYGNQLKAKDETFTELQFANQWRAAASGKQRKNGLDEDVYNELASTRMANALAKYGRRIETTADGQVMRLIDANGHVVNNPNNLNNPMTVADLAAQELGSLWQTAEKQPGGGSKAPATITTPPAGGGGGSVAIQATTRVEATKAIDAHLREQGIATNHKDYQEKFDTIYAENEVSNLPIQ